MCMGRWRRRERQKKQVPDSPSDSGEFDPHSVPGTKPESHTHTQVASLVISIACLLVHCITQGQRMERNGRWIRERIHCQGQNTEKKSFKTNSRNRSRWGRHCLHVSLHPNLWHARWLCSPLCPSISVYQRVVHAKGQQIIVKQGSSSDRDMWLWKERMSGMREDSLSGIRIFIMIRDESHPSLTLNSSFLFFFAQTYIFFKEEEEG